MVSKLILTSNGFFTDEIREAFIKIIEKERIDYHSDRAAIITTASTQKQNNVYAIKTRENLLEMGFLYVDFVDVEFDDPELLRKYKVIYISGGNPFYLLHHLRVSGADRMIKEIANQPNAIIVGASAGAVVLGPNIEVVNYFTPQMNHVDMHCFKALGITSVSIFPHYDREDIFPNKLGQSIEDRLAAFEKKNQCSITRVRDDGYIIV